MDNTHTQRTTHTLGQLRDEPNQPKLISRACSATFGTQPAAISKASIPSAIAFALRDDRYGENKMICKGPTPAT